VTGLTPNATYGGAIVTTSGAGTTVTLTPNAAGITADSAGVVRLTL
jgi:hypothetical protein